MSSIVNWVERPCKYTINWVAFFSPKNTPTNHQTWWTFLCGTKCDIILNIMNILIKICCVCATSIIYEENFTEKVFSRCYETFRGNEIIACNCTNFFCGSSIPFTVTHNSWLNWKINISKLNVCSQAVKSCQHISQRTSIWAMDSS